MKNKGDAHENLSLLFNRYVVPPKMAMDGSEEHILGSFRNKFQETDFHIKYTEPHPPWKLQAGGLSGSQRRALVRRWSKLVHLNKYGMMHWILRLT